MPREHAGRAVGKAQAGDSEPRDAGKITGLALVDLGLFLRARE